MAQIWTVTIFLLAMAFMPTGTAQAENHAGTTYKVVGVSSSDPDGLNIRDNVIEAQSVRQTNIVGSLAWNATGIVSSGMLVEIGNSTWRQIRNGDIVGWVNEKFLAAEHRANPVEITPDKLVCSGTEPFWSLDLSKSPSVFSGTDMESGDWKENEKLDVVATHSIVPIGQENWSVTLKSRARDSYLTTILSKASPMCSDGMSNLLYPYQVIMLRGQVPRPVYGCCKISLDR